MLQKDDDKLDLVIDLIHLVLKRLEQADPAKDPVFLNIVETADMFKVSERTIRRWLADGVIKGFYIGGSIHFSKDELIQVAMVNRLNKK